MGRITGAIAQTLAQNNNAKYNSNNNNNNNNGTSSYNSVGAQSNYGGVPQQSQMMPPLNNVNLNDVPQQTVVHGLGNSLTYGFPSVLPPVLQALLPDWHLFLAELLNVTNRHANLDANRRDRHHHNNNDQNAWTDVLNVLRSWNSLYFAPRGLKVDLTGQTASDLMGEDDYGRRRGRGRGRRHHEGPIHMLIGMAIQAAGNGSSSSGGARPELVITRMFSGGPNLQMQQQQQQSYPQQQFGQQYPQQQQQQQLQQNFPQQGDGQGRRRSLDATTEQGSPPPYVPGPESSSTWAPAGTKH
ncbi:hypothetical protein HKX48_000581 [Thoreauomyces humboldtii]|nr:hypothetical protein HKX48_000581 [Thoreauomyces humboldtii]